MHAGDHYLVAAPKKQKQKRYLRLGPNVKPDLIVFLN